MIFSALKKAREAPISGPTPRSATRPQGGAGGDLRRLSRLPLRVPDLEESAPLRPGAEQGGAEEAGQPAFQLETVDVPKQ